MNYFLEKGIRFIREVENEKAIKYFQAVLKEDPENTEAYRHLGLAFFNLGKYFEAKTHWKRCVELESFHHQTWWNLGQVYEVLEDFEQAIEAYKRAALSAEQNFPEKAKKYQEWVKKAQERRNSNNKDKSIPIND